MREGLGQRVTNGDGPTPATYYMLRLYVAGTSLRSMRAVETIRRLCERYLLGRYELHVIDIYRHPEQAKEGQVVAAPTLVKGEPPPLRRIVGNLADEERVLVALGVENRP